MDIKRFVLHHVELPLRSPFRTHQGTLKQRPVIIIEAEDHDGRKGYGEVTAFPTPFYTYETVETAWHILTDMIFPYIDLRMVMHPQELPHILSYIQGHPMAKAGLEGALWDLYSKQEGKSLSQVIGGQREHVKAGAVISLTDSFKDDIESLKQQGYQRFKLKVEKGREREMVETVSEFDPHLPVMIDANGQYNEKDMEHLTSLDSLGLMMIEQPFQSGDFYLHKRLQNQMETPICLDESIMSFHDAKQAVKLNSCQIINIKISRVGGLTAAINIHDFCKKAGVPAWCGGMVETGVSKAHNLALASLENFSVPGDLSNSTRYFHQDIIKPNITVENGQITVPSEVGIGFQVDEVALDQLCVKKTTIDI